MTCAVGTSQSVNQMIVWSFVRDYRLPYRS